MFIFHSLHKSPSFKCQNTKLETQCAIKCQALSAELRVPSAECRDPKPGTHKYSQVSKHETWYFKWTRIVFVSTRYLVLGDRYSVLSTWSSVVGTRWLVLGTRYSVISGWCCSPRQVHVKVVVQVQYSVHGNWYSVFGFDTWYPRISSQLNEGCSPSLVSECKDTRMNINSETCTLCRDIQHNKPVM
ncbi:hypothetical protein P692DRAFT_201811419 [Suillus brevipes Sb2]|nr:hypothetical protein P692DRAFT_201811419 [Suillus brevipes Sb2]